MGGLAGVRVWIESPEPFLRQYCWYGTILSTYVQFIPSLSISWGHSTCKTLNEMVRILEWTRQIRSLPSGNIQNNDHAIYLQCTMKSTTFLIYFLLKNNCFTEFCGFMSNLNMNQPQVCIYPLPFEPPSHLPPRPTPLGWCRVCLCFLRHTANSCRLSILHTVMWVSMLHFPYISPSPPFSPCP